MTDTDKENIHIKIQYYLHRMIVITIIVILIMEGGKQLYIYNIKLYDDKILDATKLQTGGTDGIDF